jgi:hypothetical protein
MAQIMSSHHRLKGKNSSSLNRLSMFSVVSGILLLTLCIYSANGNQARENTGAGVELGSKRASSGSAAIVSGSVNGIPYYHCAGTGTGTGTGTEQHLVLLHGARFTKEDWKTSGILDSLCTADKGLSVSAMDLPVSAGHEELKTLLTSMQTAELLTTPVALVTPSASGKTITDWMTKGDVTKLPLFISKWIPVAAGSVSNPTEEQVSSLTNNLSIFAIYGNRDAMGKRVTERLASLASAETLELDGGHPCYLDSPEDFVSAILRTMNVAA